MQTNQHIVIVKNGVVHKDCMTEPNTLDEQIDAILGYRHIPHPVDMFCAETEERKPYCFKQQLKSLFTEHSKQARIDELKECLRHVPMPTLSYEQVENRIAQLSKRNK